MSWDRPSAGYLVLFGLARVVCPCKMISGNTIVRESYFSSHHPRDKEWFTSFGEPALEDVVDVPSMAPAPMDPSLRICSDVFYYTGRQVESVLRYFIRSYLFHRLDAFCGLSTETWTN